MGRVLKYWLALAPLAVVTTYATWFLLFRLVDLSFVHFATLLCVPLIQAAVLAWRAAPPTDALVALAVAAGRHPLAQPVLAMDALVLGAGVVGWDWHLVGFGAAVSIQSSWTLVKAAAAVAFCAGAVLRSSGRQRGTVALQMVGPLLLMFAVEPSTSWLATAFALIHEVIGPRAEVLQRMAFYAPVFSILVGLTLHSSRGLEPRTRNAALLLQVAVATSLALAVTAVLASFNLPTLLQPWLGVATLWASGTATSVLLTALFLPNAGPSRQTGS